MQTLDLLTKALTINPSPKAWCDMLKINRTALNVARNRGRLSPVIAGSLAMKLGENPQQWIAIAALEAEPESDYKSQLLACVTSLYYWMIFIVVLRQRSKKEKTARGMSTPGCLAK